MSDEELEAIGAGDQGMMFGYASNETEEYMPYPYRISSPSYQTAHKVSAKTELCLLKTRWKTQVTEYDEKW